MRWFIQTLKRWNVEKWQREGKNRKMELNVIFRSGLKMISYKKNNSCQVVPILYAEYRIKIIQQ